MNVTDLLVCIKTKSNYKGLNGQFLPVAELLGTRVSCQVKDEASGNMIIADFSINEVVSFSNKEARAKELETIIKTERQSYITFGGRDYVDNMNEAMNQYQELTGKLFQF